MVGPNFMIGTLTERRNLGRERDIHHVSIKAEIGSYISVSKNANDCCPTARNLEEAKTDYVSQPSEGTNSADTSTLCS